MTASSPPPAADTPRWFRLWMLGAAVVFLVPALVLGWQQRHQRLAQIADWQAILDPRLPDPGQPAADDVPTDAARRVTIGFYLENMGDVSMAESRWTATIDVWCRWREDDGLAGPAFDPFEHLIVVGGRIDDRKLLQRIDDGPVHFELQRLDVTCTKVFQTKNFPLDRHLLVVSFENSAHPRQALLFVPDVEASAVSTRARLTGYRIEGSHAVEMPHSYRTSRGLPGVTPDTRSTYSQPRFALVIEREGWGLFAKMFQAMFVAVAVALLSCFIRPIHVDPRFGLGVGALFAAVANGYLVSSAMPEGGDFSLADVITLLGIVTILVTLAESTLSLHLYDALGRPGLSRQLDRVSFWTILGCFTASLLILVVAAAWH